VKSISKCFILFFMFMVSLWTLQAQPAAPASLSGMHRIASIEGVTEYQLANGLRVLLVPDASSSKITVDTVYLVGSRQESYGETGMAHLLEHLMFKGTPTHPNIPDEISKHGVEANASTSEDRTNYYEVFTATQENLEWALKLEADRMVHSFIARKDLDSEMTVVRNEFEMNENEPLRVLSERVRETAYLWHNYGHPTIGARSDIENVPIEHLKDFYTKYYQPDNAYLIVSGKIDVASTLALIEREFGGIGRPVRILAKPYTIEPTQDGPREVTLHRTGDVLAVSIAYHIPSAGVEDEVCLQLLSDILNNSAEGRLKKRMVESGLATQASVLVDSSFDPGLITFTATVPKDKDLNAARQELLKISQELASQPPTQTELDRARAEWMNSFEKSMSNSSRTAFSLGEAIAEGDWRLMFWERDEVKKIQLQDLQHAAQHYLLLSNMTTGLFIPESNPVRAAIQMAPDYQERFAKYTGETAVAEGEQFDSSPANIEAHTQRSVVDAIHLALLPKKTRGQVVYASLKLHFGNEQSLAGLREVSQITAMLLNKGTQKHDMQQLHDLLIANKSRISIMGRAGDVNVSVQSDREHLAEALRIVAEMLREPSFPEKEFDIRKESLVTQFESIRSDPRALAHRMISRDLSPFPKGHVEYVPTIEEALQAYKALTIDQVRKFYKTFYGVGSAEMAVVGDFDVETIKTSVKDLFHDWKSLVPYQRIADRYQPTKQKSEIIRTPDKQNAFFITGMSLNLRDDDPMYPAMVIGNYIFGGGFLNSRLAVRIRQKDGLSYGVSSSLRVDSLDTVGMFMANALCAPQNEQKVEKDFREELDRVLHDGFTQEELDAAVKGFLQSEQVDRASDGGVADSLTDQIYVGRDFRWDQQFDEKVKSLTVEDVNRAFRKLIHADQLVGVASGDFS